MPKLQTTYHTGKIPFVKGSILSALTGFCITKAMMIDGTHTPFLPYVIASSVFSCSWGFQILQHQKAYDALEQKLAIKLPGQEESTFVKVTKNSDDKSIDIAEKCLYLNIAQAIIAGCLEAVRDHSVPFVPVIQPEDTNFQNNPFFIQEGDTALEIGLKAACILTSLCNFPYVFSYYWNPSTQPLEFHDAKTGYLIDPLYLEKGTIVNVFPQEFAH